MLRAMLAVGVVLLLAAGAQADGLIASWENQMDHFGTGTDFDGAYFVTDIGVTEGSYALALDFKTGWHQGLRSAFVDGLESDWDWAFPQLAGATELKLDVTSNRTLFNNPGGSGTVQFALFMQGESSANGGTAFNQTYDYLLLAPTYYPEMDYSTETITWDLTLGGTVDPLPEFTEEAGGWLDMRIHTNVSTSITDPGIVVIDNLRAVGPPPPPPQPETGLGDFLVEIDYWFPNPYGGYSALSVVDQVDYVWWADHFGMLASTYFAPGSSREPDHYIDTADYTTWADHYGQVYLVYYPPPIWDPIPEPATLALLTFGAAGLLRRRIG